MIIRASDHKNKWINTLLLALLIIFYLVNGVFYIRAQSVTADEGGFINYAIRLIKGHPERIRPTTDNSKMPVSVINLIPRAIDQWMHPGMHKTDDGASDIFAGRYVTLMVSVLILLLVYRWSRELYGEYAGLFSVFLISFNPDIIANAGLVTTDSYSALFLPATIYALWKFCRKPSYKSFLLFSLCIAFSQLAKQSLFHLYIICPVVMLVYFSATQTKPIALKIIFCSIIFIVTNWLIINLGFYFKETNTPLGEYHFISATFIQFQNLFSNTLPVPFPKAFVTGLDMAKYYDQIGGGQAGISSFGNVTILGHSSTGGSFWYYYFVSLFYKIPISALIFIFLSTLLLLRKTTKNTFIRNELFLLFPVLYFLLYMSFLYKTQCGVRQIIFIYPFLFILCGILIKYLQLFFHFIMIPILNLYLCISVLKYWQNYYPYTNEFIIDKKTACNYVGASNLEFLQGNLFFDKYLKKHPEVKPITQQPSEGIFLINANDYLDVWNLHQYDWIKNIKPFDHVAYNGLLIKVTRNDLNHLNSTSQ